MPLCVFPAMEAREVVVDDPGTDNTVLAMELVPRVLGFPDNNDPPIQVSSNVPVSILRYYDGSYLEGQQPVQKQDIYAIVKSNCSTQLDVQFGLAEYDRSNYSSWDPFNYTDSISIEIVPTDPSVTLVDSEFLEPSSFLAYWNYTSFWCHAGVPGFNDTGGLENVSAVPTAPVMEAFTEGPTPSDVSNDVTKAPTPTGTLTSNLENKSAGVKLGGLLTTMMAAVLGFLIMFRNQGPTQKSSFTSLAVLAIMGLLLVNIHASNQETLSQHALASAPLQAHGRRLQQEPTLCAASVEIMLDGCRRAMLDNKLDLIVEAPAMRILGKYDNGNPSPDLCNTNSPCCNSLRTAVHLKM